MNDRINKKWLVDTILEGLVPSIVFLVALVCICDKKSEDFYNDWMSDNFIIFLCFVYIISFLAVCLVKYKTIDMYSKITSFIYMAIMGTLTYILIESHYRHESYLSYHNVVFIMLISVILWLVSQYKRFDFSH